jgi:eukaryotic-like serine/threonine-protein kinase
MRILRCKKDSLHDIVRNDAVNVETAEYQVAEVLEGGMGRVLKLYKTSAYSHKSSDLGGNIAVKIPRKNQRSVKCQDLFTRELLVWAGFSHSCIVPLVEILESENREMIAAMPLYDGSLRNLMQSHSAFSLGFLRYVAFSIIAGLKYAYEKDKVVHLDIKPENILFKEIPSFMNNNNIELFNNQGYRLSVSDWGIAHSDWIVKNRIHESLSGAGNTRISHCMGTMMYMAPERFDGTASSFSSDIYSVGLILFEMLVGTLPFETICDPTFITYQIKRGLYYENAKKQLADYVANRTINTKMSKLILSMIQPNSSKRPRGYDRLMQDLARSA